MSEQEHIVEDKSVAIRPEHVVLLRRRDEIRQEILETITSRNNGLKLPASHELIPKSLDISRFREDVGRVAQTANEIKNILPDRSAVDRMVEHIQFQKNFINSFNSQFSGLIESQYQSVARVLRDIGRFELPEFDLAISWTKIDPFLRYSIDAEHGDRDAALNLSELIPWQPSGMKLEALKHKTRLTGSDTETVIREILSDSILLVLANVKRKVPLVLSRGNSYLLENDGTPSFVKPDDLGIEEFKVWLANEVVRASEMELLDVFPYVPQIVLDQRPSSLSELVFTRYAVIDAGALLPKSRRGRPYGSGIFPTHEYFRIQVIEAVQVVNSKGNKVTQERVASYLSSKGLLSIGQPIRHLRMFTKQFGYDSWSELLGSL